MRFKQIEDILTWIRQFHADLEIVYRGLKEKTDKERLAMLLDYLADHEHTLADAVDKYKEDASSTLLHTWFNQLPETDYQDKLTDLLQSFSCDNTSEVLSLAIDCHDLLIDLYKNLQSSNDTPSSKTLFQNLVDMEEHEKIRMVRDAARLEDI